MVYNVEVVSTKPYKDQNAGTSGLRKRCKHFMQPNYIENLFQSIFSNIELDARKSATLIIGGDGRYFSQEAITKATRMAAANQIKKVLICQHGIGSTPAISHMIRKYSAEGAIILTASHNPGGIENDFGVKYNISTGAGAPETFTLKMFEVSKNLDSYFICPTIEPKIDEIHIEKFQIHHSDSNLKDFEVEVIDPLVDYVNHLKEIFDFERIKKFLHDGYNGDPIKLHIDARNGVAGPYIHALFTKCLGCPTSFLSHYKPLPDFGGIHPDPNMTYAKDFLEEMQREKSDFGAAYDGDADRCMIVGRDGYYVSPSDSVAIIAANAVDCIPYFAKKKRLTGVARSMPTSRALDEVAEQLSTAEHKVTCYEVPTGWKFFCNLMDAGKVDICGEESFGAGSTHLREKDGIWASLAWLSIMATHKLSVKEIVENHWKKFGRNYYTRYDYEDMTQEQADAVLNELNTLLECNLSGKTIHTNNGSVFEVKSVDNFTYHDPIDGTISSNQGHRIIFKTGDRIIVRLSGTGSSGATIRIYIDHLEKDPDHLTEPTEVVLKELIQLAIKMTNIDVITGRDKPTVIT